MMKRIVSAALLAIALLTAVPDVAQATPSIYSSLSSYLGKFRDRVTLGNGGSGLGKDGFWDGTVQVAITDSSAAFTITKVTLHKTAGGTGTWDTDPNTSAWVPEKSVTFGFFLDGRDDDGEGAATEPADATVGEGHYSIT
jgi:hypothetical protein